MVRRTIAIGGGLLLFILVVLLFRGCLDARKERAMEDYVRDSNELVELSKAESRTLFDILQAPEADQQAVSRENQVNGLRADSATLADRARDLDVPGEFSSAHDYFQEALDLRRDALGIIADQLPGALARGGAPAEHGADSADDAGALRERRAAPGALRAGTDGGTRLRRR